MPSAMFRSQRNGEKDSDLSIMETSATCELSMACRAIPESLQSKLQSCTRSLIASTTWNRVGQSKNCSAGKLLEAFAQYLLQQGRLL
jgi:hypothetical protein